MNSTRTRFVALLAVVAVALLAVVAGGTFVGILGDGPTETDAVVPSDADRPANPATNATIGYVGGYWYDDDLPVDDRDDAALTEEELEAVVYRSMARVEVIRELAFEDEVSVEVVSREEYRDDHDDVFGSVPDDERLQENVNYEALFLVDRATDAEDEYDSLYGGAVNGYYDPSSEEVVVVSDTPDAPETDEITLGHELLHALQDQHFDLSSFDRSTIDGTAARNGLVEGDAVRVETEYENRCETEWNCVRPAGGSSASSDINWGLYLILYQPYADGPAYVDYLKAQDDGWAAVDAAYDDPPASSSEVIRPGDERGPVDVDVPDRSSEEWDLFEVDGETATETVGEVGMVSMFAAGAFDATPTVIDYDTFVDDGYEYDQPATDGWAGDELVVYVSEDADPDDPTDSAEHAGYVWRSEWQTPEDADQFLEAYLDLLAGYDAEPVDDRANTYVIDEDYPGAYYVEADDDVVTIVRAPSVDDLEGIEEGASPAGEDTLAFAGPTDEGAAGSESAGSVDEPESGGSDDADAIAGAVDVGLGPMATVTAIVAGTAIVIVVRRRASRNTAVNSTNAGSAARNEGFEPANVEIASRDDDRR
ncbi:Hvo_1808 family surface protein [Natrarchaeobius chitinivorans]|uniref:PGF-CTERM sorting domain-containing protein n=1 Tax=Natrarchaeobius chitinivorans TaxID=1679083 RepID=A0A3N6N1F9_NATCH|nr:Hvo_1808 family surface protein [Natrarchaeobius chitinivorans]RQG91822.1 hypothetical protein EA473_18685 [Natrarchaeobius chitinivorans]